MKPQDLLARLEAGYEYDPMYGQLCNERDQLKTENAKLRELVCDVHEALRADKAGMFHKLTLASMEDDMRELGIEVEDGTE